MRHSFITIGNNCQIVILVIWKQKLCEKIFFPFLSTSSSSTTAAAAAAVCCSECARAPAAALAAAAATLPTQPDRPCSAIGNREVEKKM